jgi:hypothetical protein
MASAVRSVSPQYSDITKKPRTCTSTASRSERSVPVTWSTVWISVAYSSICRRPTTVMLSGSQTLARPPKPIAVPAHRTGWPPVFAGKAGQPGAHSDEQGGDKELCESSLHEDFLTARVGFTGCC